MECTVCHISIIVAVHNLKTSSHTWVSPDADLLSLQENYRLLQAKAVLTDSLEIRSSLSFDFFSHHLPVFSPQPDTYVFERTGIFSMKLLCP